MTLEFPWLDKLSTTLSQRLLPVQQQAFENFKAKGLPRLKDEMWMYTNPLAFAKQAEPIFLTDASDIDIEAYISPDTCNIIFIDGQLSLKSVAACKEQGLDLQILKGNEPVFQQHYEILSQRADGFQMLAFAVSQSALFIDVRPNSSVKKPLMLHFVESGKVQSPGMLAPMCFVNVGKGSGLQVIEKVYSVEKGGAWSQPITSYIQSEDSKLEVLKLLAPAQSQQLLFYTQLSQAKRASASVLSVMTSGKLLRNLLTVEQLGEDAVCRTRGLALIKSGEHFDMRSRLFHLKERGLSEQLYKSVVSEKARFVFNGKIYIAEGAQKVNSSMLNKNLLLGKLAEADTKPELEVYADDVQAGHGASVGQLDVSELFYLMSRGISRSQAFQLLAKAYVEELILEVESDTLRSLASQQLADQLEGFTHQIESLISKEGESR